MSEPSNNKNGRDQDTDDLAAALAEQLEIKDDLDKQKGDTEKSSPSTSITSEEVSLPPPLRPLPNKQKEDDAWNLQLAPKEIRQVAKWIQSGDLKRILVLTGAGVSVAAGIPDFRTPGTGLYDNLARYNLPYAEAVFDVEYYRDNPIPFVQLAKELWPTGLTFKPTLTHSFLTLLHRKGMLLRCYTQNIDGLEHLAKLPADALVECHGHFRTASCIDCHQSVSDTDAVKCTIVDDGQVPLCKRCGGNVKPDIVFFGEGLPDRFHTLLRTDIKQADTCWVLGTSLAVAPVSQIPHLLTKGKRILMNRERVGNIGKRNGDIFCPGDCDFSIEWLSRILGWWPELRAMHHELHAEMDRRPQNGPKQL